MDNFAFTAKDGRNPSPFNDSSSTININDHLRGGAKNIFKLANGEDSPYSEYVTENTGYQLSYSVDGEVQCLPYVLIKDRFGCHIVGLDGAYYLTMPQETYGAEGTGQYLLSSAPYDREIDILKFRSYQSQKGIDNYAKDFDFTGSDAKTYFTSNEDSILLSVAAGKSLDYDSAITNNDSIGSYGIFEKALHSDYNSDSITAIYNIIAAIDNITLFSTITSSYSESNIKASDLYAGDRLNIANS
jgi:hypothetical protein